MLFHWLVLAVAVLPPVVALRDSKPQMLQDRSPTEKEHDSAAMFRERTKMIRIEQSGPSDKLNAFSRFVTDNVPFEVTIVVQEEDRGQSIIALTGRADVVLQLRNMLRLMNGDTGTEASIAASETLSKALEADAREVDAPFVPDRR